MLFRSGKPWYLITTNSPVTYTGTVNGNDATLVDSTGATLSSPIDISCTVVQHIMEQHRQQVVQ